MLEASSRDLESAQFQTVGQFYEADSLLKHNLRPLRNEISYSSRSTCGLGWKGLQLFKSSKSEEVQNSDGFLPNKR